MNADLAKLQPYPFEKLAQLKQGIQPPGDRPHIALSIGEPRHATPSLISEALLAHLHGLANYPVTRGGAQLREAITEWLIGRFQLPPESLDPERHVVPVNGTREGLFAFAQCVVERGADPLVLMPNPFYQIYEGAALLAGARPEYVNVVGGRDLLPDFDAVPDATWRRCQLLYLCTPGNPTGAVLDEDRLQDLIRLAQEHDFVIASDECYSEIYADEAAPPVGLLQAAARMGVNDYRNCVVFHSLSKRSNAPGLRSGFAAGDARIMEQFLLYRTYHGCAMPPPTQAASIAAWRDERHVHANRDLYRQKFDAVLDILGPAMDLQRPTGGFYFWAATPGSDTEFARGLFAQEHVTVLPGSFLSREAHGVNPGHGRVRMALVASLDECVEAAQRIRRYLGTL